jgi:hypothetical protein
MFGVIQLGISTSHPVVVFLVQAIAAAGWLIGLLAGLLIYFRETSHSSTETDVRPPQLAASFILDGASVSFLAPAPCRSRAPPA